MKKPNEYVQFRPHSVIGTTRSYWRQGESPLRTLTRIGTSGLLVVGVPSLIIVPTVVYYLAGFGDWATFLGHVVAMLLFPLGFIAFVASGSALVSFWRMYVRG